MWGGLYGLSKIKIKGRWNPYLYKNQNGYSLERNTWKKTVQYFWNLEEEPTENEKDNYINEDGSLKKEGLKENVDYIQVYLPCEEQEGYVYIKSEVEGLKYTLESEEPIQVKKNDIPMRIQYSDEEDLEENRKDLYIYDSQWFANIGKNNLESVELQVNNYGDFQNKLIFEKNQHTLNQEHKPSAKAIQDLKDCEGKIYCFGHGLDESHYWILTFFDVTDLSMTTDIHNKVIAEQWNGEQWEQVEKEAYSLFGGLVDNFLYSWLSPESKQAWDDIVNHPEDYYYFTYGTKEYTYSKYEEFQYIFYLNKNKILIEPSQEYPEYGEYKIVSENLKGMGFRIGRSNSSNYHNPPQSSIGVYNINHTRLIYHTPDELTTKTNIEWVLGEEFTQKEPIHEYQWKNCNISLVSPKNNYTNIAVEDNINLCYHTLDNNTNKRIFFYDQSNELPWHSKETFYTTVSCRITDINGDEQILSQKIPLGDFYIVEDENLSTPTLSNFINPIKSGIENRKILEHFENLTASQRFAIDVDKNIKSYNLSQLPEYDRTNLTVYYDPRTMLPYEANDYSFTKANGTQLKEGNYAVIEKGDQYYKWSRTIADKGTALGQTVNITKNNFPFNFKLVGETYIRDRYQEDSHYQIELYNCAILDSININLAASGEPNIVNIKMKALTDQCGDIGRLTIYNQKSCNKVRSAAQQKQQQTYIPIDILEKIPELIAESDYEIRILHPINNTIYCLEKDCAIPDKGEFSYLKLYIPNKDDTSWKGKTYYEYYDYIKDTLNKEDLLIVKIDNNDIIQGFVTKDDIAYDFSRDEEAAP